MKKIIGLLSVFLLPLISSAQGYMMDTFSSNGRGWEFGCNEFGFGGAMFGAFLLIPILGIILAVSIFIFWVMMLVDAIKHTPEKTKLVWVVVIVFTHVIGALIYYFVEKRPRSNSKVKHTEHHKEETN